MSAPVVRHPAVRLQVPEAPTPAGPGEAERRRADAIRIVALHAEVIRERAGSMAAAVESFAAEVAAGALPGPVAAALALLTGGRAPSRATLYRWMEQARETRPQVGRRGRRRVSQGWELRAVAIYQTPGKPSIASVARQLRREGWESATYARVRRYLQSLPADLREQGRGRMGAQQYDRTQKPHRHRDTTVLAPGEIYQGDGHTVDVYIAHPMTGDIWRPELTVWIDVASRYVVGWYLSEAESQISTLLALSHALRAHDHVPAGVHIDNGSGFRSRMMSDESVGYYARFAIATHFSLPGQPQGKGQVERFFRSVKDDLHRLMPTYCGEDMAPDVLRRIVREVKAGRLALPSLDHYMERLREWVEEYNHRPHRGLGGRTPAELWQALERVPLEVPEEALVLPAVERVVRRGEVRLHNRTYSAPELVAHNGEQVVIEYDLHDDARVRILDGERRWICDAALVERTPYLPASRLEEMRQTRLEGQRKRLERKLEEARRRAALKRDHTEVTERMERATAGALEPARERPAIDLLRGAQPLVEEPPGDAAPGGDGRGGLRLDIYKTDY